MLQNVKLRVGRTQELLGLLRLERLNLSRPILAKAMAAPRSRPQLLVAVSICNRRPITWQSVAPGCQGNAPTSSGTIKTPHVMGDFGPVVRKPALSARSLPLWTGSTTWLALAGTGVISAQPAVPASLGWEPRGKAQSVSIQAGTLPFRRFSASDQSCLCRMRTSVPSPLAFSLVCSLR